MFNLGDNVILDSLRIPWLIWIQILVMFLLTLIIIFSYFGIFALDSSSSSCTAISPFKDISSSSATTQQEAGNHDSRRDIANITSSRVRHVANNSERDGPSTKDLVRSPVAERLFHPCRYFDIAKEAFLKCLGLGSGSQHSADMEHEHEE